MNYTENLRQNLINLLEYYDLTQAELAAWGKQKPCFITDLFLGNANPTLKTLQDLSDGFNIPLTLLLKPADAEEWQAFFQFNPPKPKKNELPPPHIPKGWDMLSQVVLPTTKIDIIKEWLQVPKRGRPRKADSEEAKPAPDELLNN